MIYEVKNFLELHKMLLKHGLKSVSDKPIGLCNLYVKIGDAESNRLTRNEIFQEIKPFDEPGWIYGKKVYSDYANLREDNVSLTHWGSGSIDQLQGVYTPMRQNLILLCAALNNEL